MQLKQRQKGFTLVEIAVVLVIIGLLLGGVLKGQELIESARVRNLADQQAGIQAAYFGFQDRYRAIPGDMPKVQADNAIQANVNSGGDANGKIDAGGSAKWTEPNAVWEHLSKAGFIKGNYNGSDNQSDLESAPTNVFNGIPLLVWDDSYLNEAGTQPPEKVTLHMGRNIPASVARELDVKIDDGRPATGIVRGASTSYSNYGDLGHTSSACTTTTSIDGATVRIWDINTNAADCNPTYLF